MISKILFPVRTVFNWLLDSYRRVCDLRPDDSPVMEYIIWITLILVLAGFMVFAWVTLHGGMSWGSLIG